MWNELRYCSERCRRRGIGPIDERLEQAIVSLLAERERSSTICPSEAARRAAGDEDWQALMAPARAAARRLVARGLIEITQRGAVVRPVDGEGCDSPSTPL